MHLSDLLLALEYKQIELFVKNGALGYRAPAGAFTDALLEEVKRHKQDLIGLIERGLAQVERWSSDDRDAGELPLTPWHGWYLETFDPVEHRWSVTRHAHIGGDADFDLVREAVHLTMSRYDTFRQRLYRKQDGEWALRILSAPGEPKIVLSDATENTEKCMLDIQKDVERTLSMVDGPVIYVALCKNRNTGDVIVVNLHHNIVDAYCVESIVSDMVDVYKRLSGHQVVDAEIKKACSYASYTETLHQYMSGPMFLARSLSYWGGFINAETPRIPVDFVGGLHTANNSKIITLYVGADVLSSKNTSLMNDSLLIAAVAAIAHWSGHPMVAIDVEHHGRGGHTPGIDFLEVVGPTTFKFPMWFDVEPDSLSSPGSFEALRKRITDVTQHGLGYGFLRYLHPDQEVRSDFQRMPRPQVFLNNRTTLFVKGGAKEDGVAMPPRKSGIFRVESHSDPELHDPYSHELLIECDRAWDGIEISLIYSEKIHRDDTIIELAETLLSKLQRISEVCV
ncbi:condensation domain-containing protein [Dyella subtropica]|uniref:condensation domain-containing protein n=1 Tax=Dyella subtropica TaxID=2992127 RepID=UPI002254B4B2|nr:condensation domain-containing protein [Dyella subtropica]